MSQTLESLRTLLQKKSGSMAFAWLADLQRRAGDLDSALPTVEAGLKQYPTFLPGLMVKGSILFDMNELDEAESILRKVLDRNPTNLAAVRMVAQICAKLNRKAEAEVLLENLKELDPLGPAFPAVLPEPKSTAAQANPFEDLTLDAIDESATQNDGPSSHDLLSTLDAALGTNEPTRPEYFPADDASITSGDVGSAISDLFGTAKPAEAPPKTIAPGSKDLSSALDELFGDEEPATGNSPETSVSPFTSDSTSSPFASHSTSSPFASDSTSSPFSSFSTPPPIPAAPTTAKEDSIFGANPFPSSSSLSKPSEQQDEMKGDLASALNDLFGDEDEPFEELPKAPSAFETSSEPSPMEPAPVAPVAKAQDDFKDEFAGALDSLFGDEDDSLELDVVKTEEELPLLEEDVDLLPPVQDLIPVSLQEPTPEPIEEQITEPELEPSSEPIEEVTSEPKQEIDSSVSEFGQEVSNVLDDLFGDNGDDALTEALIQDPTASLEGEILDVNIEPEASVDSAPAQSEPSTTDPEESSLEGEVSSALDRLLGEDDELDLDLGKGTSAFDDPGYSAPIDLGSGTSSSDLDDLASENVMDGSDVSNALDNLFGDGFADDALEEDIGGNAHTRTLAEIYMGQGLHVEALQIYKQLLSREPDNQVVSDRITEIEAMIGSSDGSDSEDRDDDLDNPRPRPPLPGPRKRNPS